MLFHDLPVKIDGRSYHQFNGLLPGTCQGRSRCAYWPDKELQKIESDSGNSIERTAIHGRKNFRFWMGLLQDYGLSRSIKIWMLYLDDGPVSFRLVLDTGPIRYQLVDGHSKSVKQYSTGHILFKGMIFNAIEIGVEQICFGQGDSGCKREWGAKSSVELIDLIAMKSRLFGKLASVAHNTTMKLVK